MLCFACSLTQRHCMMYRPLCLLFLLLLCHATYGQPRKCKAKLRANRHKTMTFDTNSFFELLAYSFDTWKGEHVYVSIKKDYDSVYAQLRSGHMSVFTVDRNEPRYGKRVTSPYIEYEKNDQRLVDSIDLSRPGARHRYFTSYQSGHVLVTTNITEHTRRYYRTSGVDSILFTDNSDGSKRTDWYSLSGRDTAFRHWNPAGILTASRSNDNDSEFYADGVLQTARSYVSIEQRQVRYERNYFPTGRLESEKYYCESWPCHNWRCYNERGQLIKTLRKKAVTDFPIAGYGVLEAPAPDEVVTFVEQNPEFPGGRDSLQRYIDERLSGVLCRSTAPLDGTYSLQMQLEADGNVTWMHSEGQNAAAIDSEFRMLFGGMPRWQPAKMNGSRPALVIRFRVMVKKK